MNFNSKTASVLGAVGLGAIALLGATMPATAVSVRLGTDYLFTPGDGSTFLDFDGPGGMPPVVFQGVPINEPILGLTDTIVQRKDNVTLDATTLDANGFCISSDCQTRIEMTDLRLVSLDGSISVTLNPNKASTGWMTINHESSDNQSSPQKTFSSVLDVFFKATFPNGDMSFLEKRFVVGQNPYTLDPNNPLFKPDPNGLSNPNNTAPGVWSHNPLNNQVLINPGDPPNIPPDRTISRGQEVDANNQTANCHVSAGGPPCAPDDFFVQSANHETGNGEHTVVSACQGEPCPVPEQVPEPSATVPLALFGLAGLWSVRKRLSH